MENHIYNHCDNIFNIYSQDKPKSVDYGVLINTTMRYLPWETDTNTYKYRDLFKNKETAW
ncbi:hypothetical protein MASR1M45_27720 [Candidatus Kapaibacterium sp.]